MSLHRGENAAVFFSFLMKIIDVIKSYSIHLSISDLVVRHSLNQSDFNFSSSEDNTIEKKNKSDFKLKQSFIGGKKPINFK
jgi:hypothetical protein